MSRIQDQPSRRGFMFVAVAAGAATAAVVTLPRIGAPESAAAEPKPPAPANGGGYRVTEHVKHYYRTTQV